MNKNMIVRLHRTQIKVILSAMKTWWIHILGINIIMKLWVFLKIPMCVAVIWRPQRDHNLLQELGHNIRASIKANRKFCSETTVAEVVDLLSFYPLFVKEVWVRMREWYCDIEDLPPTPDWFTIARMKTDRVELYRIFSCPWWSIPVALDPSPVEELVTG